MRILAVLAFLFVVMGSLWAERLTLDDFKAAEYPLDSTCSKTIEIGHGIQFQLTGEITARNHGNIKICNLELNVYAYGCDPMKYENGLLDIDFVDLDGDAYKDIVISGTVLYCDEKIEDLVLRREPVVFIYMFMPEKNVFYCTYRNASFSMDVDDDNWDITSPLKIDQSVLAGRKKALEENEVMSKKPRSERK